jgi:hypothetical protein
MNPEPPKSLDLKDEHFPALFSFFQKSGFLDEDIRNVSHLADLLKWHYFRLELPTQTAVVIQAGKDIRAHYGLMPVRYLLNGEEVSSGICSKLLMAPEARARMGFFSFQKFFFSTAAANGVRLIYGLAHREDALRVYLRSGYKKVATSVVSVRLTSAASLVRDFGSVRMASFLMLIERFLSHACARLLGAFGRRKMCISVSETTEFPESLGALTDLWLKEFRAYARRDAQALQWRYQGSSTRQYRRWLCYLDEKCVGYAVTREMKMLGFSVLAVADYAVDQSVPGVTRALVQYLSGVARAQGLALLAVLAPQVPSLRLEMLKARMFPTPKRFTLIVADPKGPSSDWQSLKSEHWYYTWFDNDVV